VRTAVVTAATVAMVVRVAMRSGAAPGVRKRLKGKTLQS
jgi:hypothetical protein